MPKKHGYAEREHKPCKGCGGPVTRHDDEIASAYFDRLYCTRECYNSRAPDRIANIDIWPPKIPEHEDFGAGFGAHNLRFRPNVVRYAQPVAMHSYASSSAAWEAEE